MIIPTPKVALEKLNKTLLTMNFESNRGFSKFGTKVPLGI